MVKYSLGLLNILCHFYIKNVTVYWQQYTFFLEVGVIFCLRFFLQLLNEAGGYAVEYAQLLRFVLQSLLFIDTHTHIQRLCVLERESCLACWRAQVCLKALQASQNVIQYVNKVAHDGCWSSSWVDRADPPTRRLPLLFRKPLSFQDLDAHLETLLCEDETADDSAGTSAHHALWHPLKKCYATLAFSNIWLWSITALRPDQCVIFWA